MKTRRKAREAVLQALYQCDTLAEWDVEGLGLYFERYQQEVALAQTHELRPGLLDNFCFCKDLLAAYILNREVIDQLIGDASDRWSIRRMARVDRNVLRLATTELVAFADIPAKVSINEAIELAKQFGTNESPVFINGVLDNLASSKKSVAINKAIAGFWSGEDSLRTAVNA
ncbi:MAG: transcription antitermination factor NusB [Bdellovibrionales bacterium]|nr:transcription antitermination factor NusB [Bdellovibrionales bacterium]